MKLGDFSSVVQLGVGLHAGTALLQSVTEFAGTPLTKRLERLRSLAEVKARKDTKYQECVETAADLLGELEVKKIQFFNEYKEVAKINGAVAIALCFVLSIQAFDAEEIIPAWVGALIVLGSLIPAGGSLLYLHRQWTANAKPLVERIDALNAKIFPKK